LLPFQKQICLCNHFVSLFLLNLDDQKGRKQYLFLYSQLQWRTTDKVEKIINNINIKKATGVDGIPAKIIKCSKSIIAPQITSILNMSIDPEGS
jgi:hypothetical protein